MVHLLSAMSLLLLVASLLITHGASARQFEPKGYIANASSYYPYLAGKPEEIKELVEIRMWYGHFPQKIKYYAQQQASLILLESLPQQDRIEFLMHKVLSDNNVMKIENLPEKMRNHAVASHKLYSSLPKNTQRSLAEYMVTKDNGILQGERIDAYLNAVPIKIIRQTDTRG